MVRDRRGNFMRKVLGEVDEGAEFPVYRMNGQELRINPNTDVVLRDPTSGKMLAFERDPKLDYGPASEGAYSILEGIAAGPVAGVRRVAGAAAQTADRSTQAAIARANAIGLQSAEQLAASERARDLTAFERLGTPAFPPAFADKGMARTARTIEEMPSIVGQTVKGPKTETLIDLGEAQRRIARDLGAPSDELTAGVTLQQGLDRFRATGTRELEPGTLTALGVQPRAPGRYVGELVEPMPGAPPVPVHRQVITQADGTLARFDPAQHVVVRDAGRAAVYETARGPASGMSAGAAQRVEQAAPIRAALGGGMALTSRGVEVPAARGIEQMRIQRRGVEDFSDAELARLVRAPAAQTSFVARQEALYEHAHRQLPKQFRINETANPQELRAVNTNNAFKSIVDAEKRAGISGGLVGGRLGSMAERVKTNVTLNSLRAMRTEVGRQLANFGMYDARLDRTQLKQIYGAVSRDIEIAYQDLANRAYIATRAGHNRPDRVPSVTAQAADRALYEFRRADRFTRMGMERMDRFSRMVGADNPQDAVRMLGRFLRENTGNAQAVRAIRDALRPEEWQSLVGHVVERLGKGRAGAQEAEAVWNPAHFATDWAKLKNSPAAQAFFRGLPTETRQALGDLARAAERMKYYETTKNYSGTAYSGIPVVTAMGAVYSGGVGAVVGLVAQIGGAVMMGKFLTSPRYLRILADKMDREASLLRRAPKMPPEQLNSERLGLAMATLNQLLQVAKRDEELMPVLQVAAEQLGVDEDRKPNRNVDDRPRPQ